MVVWWYLVYSVFVCFFTGSIVQSTSRRYLIYSEADSEVFLPRRGDMLHRWGWNLAWSSMPNFTPSVQRLGYRTPKLKFLLTFDQNVEYLWNICLFVCLSVTPLNVRDCVPNFAMKVLEYRNEFDTVWWGRFVVFQLSQNAANWQHHKMLKSKNGKIWGFSPPDGDRINRSRWILAHKRTPNLAIIDKRGWVQEPPKCQNLVKIVFCPWKPGRWHNKWIQMKYGM